MSKQRSGFELVSELERVVIELDSVDPEDDDEFNAWLSKLESLLEQTGDKMLSYRLVISLAGARQDFFRGERDRYATRFRVQGRVVARVKEFAHMMLESHHTLTGKSRMDLADGTWATLTTRKDFEFYDAETGETKLDPRKVPPGFVKMEISRTELKRAAKLSEEIPGVEYREVEKTHVRWS